MSATRVEPVAIVLASSAIATFPPASRSPMMPEPTTAASRKAVPSASATARRATALLRSRFNRAGKTPPEFVFHLWRDTVHVDALARQELPRVLDAVNSGWLDIYGFKSGFGE